jgi:hypothetical protein
MDPSLEEDHYVGRVFRVCRKGAEPHGNPYLGPLSVKTVTIQQVELHIRTDRDDARWRVAESRLATIEWTAMIGFTLMPPSARYVP